MEITDEIRELILEKYPKIKRCSKEISYIVWDKTTGLVRFIANKGNGERLQQEHTFLIRYKRPVTYGSLDTYMKDYGTIWLDVPHIR